MKHKNLSSQQSKGQNKRLLHFLQKQSRKTLQKTHLPLFTFTEDLQTGDNFGDRLSNAIESVFNLDFESVIVIGNDCPDLNSEDILKTQELLKDQKLVLGPDLRGGLYLIGIQKKAFSKESFRKLKWQSSELQKSIIKFAEKSDFNYRKLKSLFDLNFSENLEHYLSSKNKVKIGLVILSLFQYIDFGLLKNLNSNFPKVVLRQTLLRGPPLV